MELKVWVEGIQRIVCGVTETTTCQDIVFALAHATGKTGRFTLIEKWRNNERIMAPSENPLKILIKWGEYSSDVQFILQKSQTAKPQIQNNSNSQRMLNTDMPLVNNASEPNSNSPEKSKDIPKSLGPSNEEKLADNVGIVRPQKPLQDRVNSPDQYGQFNSADIRNSLDRLTFQNNQQDSDVGSSSTVLSKAMSSIDSNDLKAITSSPPISANGALMPPPYRNPPPPKQTENNTPNETKGLANSYSGGVYEVNENYLNAAHYVDLVQLITMQRDKLNMQQSEINKCDAEINYFENKEREHLHKIELMNGELVKLEQIYRQGKDQLQMLQYVEEENELVKQQEKTLKSEIMLLRSKLANCETELLQYRNKIKLLMDDIQIEQEMVDRNFSNHQDNMERQFFVEMERLQSDIQQAIQQCDSTAKANESLKTELHVIEDAIVDKKKEVELLFNEMKEVNLQSLTATSSEEIRNLLDVSNRPGSTRRILGSPRQLENAVPTSKNPHGVWV